MPPPEGFSREYRAMLAAAAEFLCADFGLGPAPKWTNYAVYFLPILWEPDGWMFPEDEEFLLRRVAKAHPAFLRRNVLYRSRDLITLRCRERC